jgi:uncharacterized protein YunC (DUF1805 family)
MLEMNPILIEGHLFTAVTLRLPKQILWLFLTRMDILCAEL